MDTRRDMLKHFYDFAIAQLFAANNKKITIFDTF